MHRTQSASPRVYLQQARLMSSFKNIYSHVECSLCVRICAVRARAAPCFDYPVPTTESMERGPGNLETRLLLLLLMLPRQQRSRMSNCRKKGRDNADDDAVVQPYFYPGRQIKPGSKHACEKAKVRNAFKRVWTATLPFPTVDAWVFPNAMHTVCAVIPTERCRLMAVEAVRG